MHQHIHDEYAPVIVARRAVRAAPVAPRALACPASAGVVDARDPSYAAPSASGSMHPDYRGYHAPVSAARCQVVRSPRTELVHAVRPRRELDGLEPSRPQWDYAMQVDGRTAGVLQLVELEPRLAFVAWVQLQPWARGLGLGVELHRRVLDDFGALAVEDFASADERRLLATMVRQGCRLTERAGQAALGVTRHCRVVDRMYVLHPPLASA